MKIVDANVLIYAVNRDAAEHEASRRWLDSALSGGDGVGFAWVVLLAFVRLTTKHGLFREPLRPDQAMEQVNDWLGASSACLVAPAGQHTRLLSEMIDAVGTGGNLVTDAQLAALAREHRAEIVTYDHDFSRFPGVTWRSPGELLAR